MNIAVQSSMPAVEQELGQVLCACPFSYMGLQKATDGKGLVLRVWRPDADDITVYDLTTGRKTGEMQRFASGMFELNLPRRRNPFYYELEITKDGGHTFKVVDPYQFGEYVLREEHVDYDTLYHHQGAHLIEHKISARKTVKGVLFRVYAPNARSVSIIGAFNNWDGRLHPMASADDGIWRLFIPGLQAGDLYKYEIHDQQGKKLPLKADPFGTYTEQWPGLASIVHDPDQYKWNDQKWLEQRGNQYNEAMSIYEIHAGSWRRKDGNVIMNYRELAMELVPYVKKMGFTHIELMPVSEHPLYESWGYQPVGMFSVTSRYGSPDDFKFFVDHCHEAGIGVILDWVPAHFPNDEHGLANFDGSPVYEHPDPRRGWHPDWQTCIYDFGKPWVQDFLISSALYWLDEYHIDGLRVDAVASMLYLDYSRKDGEWEPNRNGGNENLEAIHFLKRFNRTIYERFPTAMTIAEESTSYPGVSRPLYDDGLGFGYKWNMGWMHDSLEYMKLEPVHRSYHHDQITFSTVYAWSENFILSLSHDEVVYGKGTLLTRMPGDDWQKFANLRTYLSFMWTHPGKKLLFMGCEFGTWNEWNHHQSLDWHLLDDKSNAHTGIQNLVQDLNKLYKAEPSLHERDVCYKGFQWLVHDDYQQSVLAYVRYCNDGHPIVVINNLTPVVRENYCLGVPAAGSYELLLNSDNTRFGGSGVEPGKLLKTEAIEQHGQEQSLSLTLPPLATIVMKLK